MNAPDSAHDLTDGLTGDVGALLALEPAGEDVWRSVRPDTNFGGEVFGGQYLGLSVGAAMRSAPGRAPHAMTSYFLRSARASRPVDYHVERTRDGRGFAHRRVTAIQDAKEVFRAEVSFHDWEGGQAEHGARAPAFPPMETLTSLHQNVRDRADRLDTVTMDRVLKRRTFDTYFLDPDEGLGKAGVRPETIAWLRPHPTPSNDDPVAYYTTLAYLTDACANFPSRTTHATALFDGQMMSVSLNHAIWFHARPRPIERVLYAMEGPFSGGGLGYNRGAMYGVDGDILASVVQEALIRRQQPKGN